MYESTLQRLAVPRLWRKSTDCRMHGKKLFALGKVSMANREGDKWCVRSKMRISNGGDTTKSPKVLCEMRTVCIAFSPHVHGPATPTIPVRMWKFIHLNRLVHAYNFITTTSTSVKNVYYKVYRKSFIKLLICF